MHNIKISVLVSSLQILALLHVLGPAQRMPPKYVVTGINATLLVGETYDLECVGYQTQTPVSLTMFHTLQDFGTPLKTYRDPGTEGFPFYRIDAVTLEDGDRGYYCELHAFPPGPGITTAFSEVVGLTVHGTLLFIHVITVYGAQDSSVIAKPQQLVYLCTGTYGGSEYM